MHVRCTNRSAAIDCCGISNPSACAVLRNTEECRRLSCHGGAAVQQLMAQPIDARMRCQGVAESDMDLTNVAILG